MRRGGGSRGSSLGMSRPFGKRPSYSGRRYLNRSTRSRSGSSDAEGLILGLICRGICCLIEESYYYQQQQEFEQNYNYNYRTTYPSSSKVFSKSISKPKTAVSTTTSSSVIKVPVEVTTLKFPSNSSEKCPKCGEKMLSEDKFCLKCGFKNYNVKG